MIIKHKNETTNLFTVFHLLFAFSSFSNNSTNLIFEKVAKQVDKAKEIYIDLRQNSELSFMKFETSKKMALDTGCCTYITKTVNKNKLAELHEQNTGI